MGLRKELRQAPGEAGVMEKPSLPTMICSLCQCGVEDSMGLKRLGYGFPAGLGRKDPPFLEPVPLKPANDAIWSTGAISDLATFVSGCPALPTCTYSFQLGWVFVYFFFLAVLIFFN